MTKEYDVMARMPELPSDTTPTAAAMWAASVLLHAAVQRSWPREELRKVLLVLCLRVGVDDLSDAELLTEVRTVLAQLRAPGGALRQ
jgi:hypothetical protein